MATKTIDNVIYITTPDTSGCDGCVAQGVQSLCNKLTYDTDNSSICANEGSIWIKWADAQDKPAITRQPMTKNTINGVTYFEAPETDGCEGCVARNDPPLCVQLQQTGGSYNYCAAHDVIWILPTKSEDKDTILQPMKYKINDVTYKTIRETDACEGCVALDDSRLCAKLRQGNDDYCCEHGAIWIEQVTPFDIKTLQTSQGPLQPAPVEGHKPCSGCVAQLNARLCNEIGDQHNCVQNPGTIWLRVQQPAPNIPEVLQILQEECAEVIQAVSKVQRFGFLAQHPERTKTNKQELEEELGDLLAMIQILTDQNFLDKASITLATQNKIGKLKQYSTVWK